LASRGVEVIGVDINPASSRPSMPGNLYSPCPISTCCCGPRPPCASCAPRHSRSPPTRL
jgi:hypothetical protein